MRMRSQLSQRLQDDSDYSTSKTATAASDSEVGLVVELFSTMAL
jgi:hypothetical protein